MSDKFEKITNYTQADDPEYKGHVVFSSLNEFISFYGNFSETIMHFLSMGTKAFYNIDSYVYSSIQGTLESIKMTLESGRMGDAFALLRKYHDSIILNLYTNLYLEKNRSLEKNIVEEVTDWLSGKNRLPHNDYGKMPKYVETSDELKEFFENIYKNKSYEKTRQRCNDYVHYNYFDAVLINDNRVHYPNRIDMLDLFHQDLENLFILHSCSIFYLNDHYMMSTNYIDSLSIGVTPEPEEQYEVAPFIQKIFSELIDIKRPDLAKIIKDQTSMNLS